MARRIRIGIDTGGTFTDVVALDEETGELVTTKTPSTPSNPADGFINGVTKVLGLLDAAGTDITAVSHGTTVATNKLLEGKVERLGFIVTPDLDEGPLRSSGIMPGLAAHGTAHTNIQGGRHGV